MTVVVADASPLNYLVLIGQIDVMFSLYSRVLVPPEVFAELTARGAPREVLDWIQARPEWLNDPDLQQIDLGERAAILLAQEERDVLLLIDDAAGRLEARRRQIPSTGTLGILRVAAIRGLLDLPEALTRLSATNFRASQSLIDDLIAEDSKRRQSD